VIVHLVVACALTIAPARDPQAVAGEAAFAEERWDDASVAFDAAYRNTGDPAFLYARAQAERRAGRCKLAIVLYEQFVATGVGPEGSAAAKQYIEECRALLPADPPPATDPVAEPVVGPMPPPPVAPPRPWHRDPLAASLVGAGGAAAVAGAVLVALAYRGARRADDASDDERFASGYRSASRLELGGAVALSIGTALVIGGVVRWAVLRSRARERSATASR
jgi:hypothetical protein